MELINKNINDGINLNDAEDIKMVCDKLNEGYSTIKMYNQFVDFKNAQDKELYTAENPKTKVSRLLSVYDVWVDFVSGKEGGLAFAFWILVSILVDVAAFVFFIIAFKKQDLLAELKNRLKISIFLWRKKLCISLIFSNFVVSNYKVIYFTLCTTCMQIS